MRLGGGERTELALVGVQDLNLLFEQLAGVFAPIRDISHADVSRAEAAVPDGAQAAAPHPGLPNLRFHLRLHVPRRGRFHFHLPPLPAPSPLPPASSWPCPPARDPPVAA